MDIVHNIVTFFIPSATYHQSGIIALSLLVMYTIGMYVYRCIRKPYTANDLSNAVTQYHNTLKTTCLDYENRIADYSTRIAELESQLTKTQPDIITVDGKYQRERVIAALAVELDGFAAIEEKANVIVNALK